MLASELRKYLRNKQRKVFQVKWRMQMETKYTPTIDEMMKIGASFTYHSPKPDQIPRYQELRDKGFELAKMILETVPPSRERSTAITKLEETIMWANKGMACNEN